ncbi:MULTISPECIES: hypothetical protein [Catenuloplanes]|uniref:Uncharacterized protein n=1 Tax=Catenuloplanes niger TaxID=587534 RepID=A0AAE3ZRP8_9ACTN|nr:hypothetical protein [Catenuloplanes niger]MDR7322635.1 hypothetical protein [Catenuloplanes niger]
MLDLADNTVVATLPGADYSKIGLALAPDGRRLITATEGSTEPLSGSLKIWSLDPQSLVTTACQAVGRDLTSTERQTYLAPLVPDKPTCSPSDPVPSKPAPDPKTQAQTTSAVLQQMNRQRLSIRNPIDSSARCAGDLETHSRALTEAGAAREYLASQLARHDMSALPQGSLLKNRMRNALNLSGAVDREFAQWAADLGGTCHIDTATANPHYERALALSQLASLEKQEVSRLWTATANQYGYPQWTAAQL